MTAEMPFKFLQVKIDYDSLSLEGKDAEDFNQMSLFRYNTYMRIYRVFFNKVRAVSPIRKIPLTGITRGIVANLGGRRKFKTGTKEKRLPDVGMELFNGPIYPKFISYLDPTDGYPVIIPCFQIRAIEHKTLTFTLSQFKKDLKAIPENAKVAAFVMDFELRTMLVKGTYLGVQKGRGQIDIEQVYNSMPPKFGYIYPKLEVKEKVTDFSL